ncbi:MAG: ATP-binding protein, partial [Actinomycetes bacterium]
METHQLEAKLRSLRLSGMLATLEARLAQARAGELGHLEFLEVLLEDEIGRREAKALAERIRRAHFESEVTLEEFDFAYNPGLPAPLIRDLAALRFIERGESVLLYGPVGVGKTHVATALGHAACRRGWSVLFMKTSRLLAELAGGRADGTWEQRLRRLARFDLLILDDFALRAFTASQGDDFCELVSERSQQGSFIITA